MALPSPLRGAIVAMNKDRVIGMDGDLPWHYSADLKRFKRRTLNTTIIMGRLTWESIGAKPLPGRRNVIVSRSVNASLTDSQSNTYWYNDLNNALTSANEEDAWIIGGGQLYAASMHWLNLIDITLVPDEISRTDVVRFPELETDQWRLVEEQPLEEAPQLTNQIYQRVT